MFSPRFILIMLGMFNQAIIYDIVIDKYDISISYQDLVHVHLFEMPSKNLLPCITKTLPFNIQIY